MHSHHSMGLAGSGNDDEDQWHDEGVSNGFSGSRKAAAPAVHPHSRHYSTHTSLWRITWILYVFQARGIIIIRRTGMLILPRHLPLWTRSSSPISFLTPTTPFYLRSHPHSHLHHTYTHTYANIKTSLTSHSQTLRMQIPICGWRKQSPKVT